MKVVSRCIGFFTTPQKNGKFTFLSPMKSQRILRKQCKNNKNFPCRCRFLRGFLLHKESNFPMQVW